MRRAEPDSASPVLTRLLLPVSTLPSPGPSSEPHSRGSSAGSPTDWCFTSPYSSPRPESAGNKGKGKAVDRGGELLRQLARTRSFEARQGTDLEGGSSKARLDGLGLGVSGSVQHAEAREHVAFAAISTRNKASPQLGAAPWRPPNPLSVLTRRRVSPGSELPLVAPPAARSVSAESSSSSSSSASSTYSVYDAISLRLQRASRPHRSRRKHSGIESMVLYASGCACLVVIVLLVMTGSVWPWQSDAAPARAVKSPVALRGRSSPSWFSGRSMAPERDTLVLYRILGNDLPPRHTHGQTLRNVRFMLQHEHDFVDLPAPIKRVEKYYVLNRIASEDTVLALRTLFAEFDVPNDRILYLPFEWDQYAEASLAWAGGVADYPAVWNLDRPDYSPPSPFEMSTATGELTEEKRQQQETMGRLRAIDFTYHEKNQYAINNNGGRNFALSHGRTLRHARWILPLDGNCFFTPSAMQSLVQEMTSSANEAASPRYVVIPMTRLLGNDAVLHTNHLVTKETPASLPPAAPEEPQIGFRYDAMESFQAAMRYGRRSKLEMLWRLGAISRSRDLHKRTLPWETLDRQILTDASYGSVKSPRATQGFVSAGWVFRLFSGDSRQERFSPEANVLRNMNRVKGIVAFLERLDEILVRGKRCPTNQPACGFSKDRFWAFENEALFNLASDYRQGRSQSQVEPLLQLAEGARQGLDARLRADRPTLISAEEASRNATALALAGYITGNATLTYAAATLVQMRFLGDGTETGPGLSLQEKQGSEGAGYTFPFPATTYDSPLWLHASEPSAQWPADFDATQLLDTLRLLSPAHLPRVLRKPLRDLMPADRVQAVLSAHLARLLSQGGEKKTLEQGAAYDLQVAALASAVDDARLVGRVASRASLRYRQSEEAVLAHRWLAQGLSRTHFTPAFAGIEGRAAMNGDAGVPSQMSKWGYQFSALEL